MVYKGCCCSMKFMEAMLESQCSDSQSNSIKDSSINEPGNSRFICCLENRPKDSKCKEAKDTIMNETLYRSNRGLLTPRQESWLYVWILDPMCSIPALREASTLNHEAHHLHDQVDSKVLLDLAIGNLIMGYIYLHEHVSLYDDPTNF